MDQAEQLQYLDEIKDNTPIGAGRMLMNIATTIALAHGTQVARGLFADIAAIEAFWDQVEVVRSQVHGAQLAEVTAEPTSGSVSSFPPPNPAQQAPFAVPAMPQAERRTTAWEIVDMAEGKVVHTFETTDNTEAEALDSAAKLMGFPSFAAAIERMPALQTRFRARRRGSDFDPAPPPPQPTSTLAEIAAAAAAQTPELAAPAAAAAAAEPQPETNKNAVVLGNVHELAGVDLPKKTKNRKGNGAPQ